MKKFALLLIIVFSMVLVSGCTDVSDEFKKEVESTNAIMRSNFNNMSTGAYQGDPTGMVNAARFMNRDSKESRERIMAITNTNETLKNEYLSALRRMEDSTYPISNVKNETLASLEALKNEVISNIKAGMILAASDARDAYNEISNESFNESFKESFKEAGDGLEGLMKVQSIWDESIRNFEVQTLF